MCAEHVTPTTLRQHTTQQLIDSMALTLQDQPGVGLAAPQVGEQLRVIVAEDKSEYHKKLSKQLLKAQGRVPVPLTVIVNPEIEIIDDALQYFFEGCLSVEGYRAVVPRARSVRVKGLDRDGEPLEVKAEGWFARILQHEFDHLQGDLYLSKMLPHTFVSEKNFAKDWIDALPYEISKLVDQKRSKI